MCRNLRRVGQFCTENPAFTPASLRWLIFNAAHNGMDKAGAVVRLDRRVFIDADRFFKWIESRSGNCPEGKGGDQS